MFRQNMLKRKLVGLVAALLFGFQCLAEEVQLTADHPEAYVVVKGDTLWAISGRFLEQPWMWPDVWHNNPQISNPHLIYPGDTIRLVYIDGQPRLTVDRGEAGNTVKLSPDCPEGKLCPKIHEQPLEQAIPAIPLNLIDPFLVGDRIVMPEELDNAPYVLKGSQEHVITGLGDYFYARGTFDKDVPVYGIYRAGKIYRDAETEELLGMHAIEIGSARAKEAEADVAQFNVLRSTQDVRANDRLLASQERSINSIFNPSPPKEQVEGTMIGVANGVNQVGRNTVVILDRGKRDGLDVGNVLAIYQLGETVRDPVTGEAVKLLNERAGLLMVFNVFEKTSFGLVLQVDRPLKLGAVVRNP